MTNETTASQPKSTPQEKIPQESIGDDAQFIRLLNEWHWSDEDADVKKAYEAIVAFIEARAPADQASAELVRNNVPGSPHNVCRTTEHNLRKRIAELEAKASATIQAAPEGFMHALLPIDPTEAMVQAGIDSGKSRPFSYASCFRAMLAAAPAATIQEPVMVAEQNN